MENIVAGYGKKQVLHDVSLDISPGDVIGLVGTNGAGKSTALRVLGGTLSQWNGKVVYAGEDISVELATWRSNHGIGFLLPGAQVFPSMTVSENLQIAKSFALKRGDNSSSDEDLFQWFPELRVNAVRRAGLLSGGERLMLALSMVLVQTPSVLLLDEPAEGLAQDLAYRVMEQVSDYIQKNNAAALVVEHDTKLVLKFCSTIHFMSQGCIQSTLQASAPDVEDILISLYFESRQ